MSPVKISEQSNPTAEIANQQELMEQAYNAQVDVLAPEPFNKAQAALSRAQKDNGSGKSSESVLESVGYSKAYLTKANQDASQAKPQLTEVVQARGLALAAGARISKNELAKLDDKFRSLTDHPEDVSEIKAETKRNLQSQYLDLELSSIKNHELSPAQNILDAAKKKGAQKLTPVAYDQAKQKLNITEKVIETDRHNKDKIAEASKQAISSAQRVLALVADANASKSQTPEQRAVALETRQKAADQANLDAEQARSESSEKDSELAHQGAALSLTERQNRRLQNHQQEDQLVEDAAAEFTKDEADVYRQDGNLVIRLKAMNFASGRSDLPPHSLAVLAKVKDVIKKLGNDSVTVEGHTDSIGSQIINQKLSEDRAESVAKFLSTDKALASNHIDSKGYGYGKPLSTNKTQEGRAQNRRVDIVIKNNMEAIE